MSKLRKSFSCSWIVFAALLCGCGSESVESVAVSTPATSSPIVEELTDAAKDGPYWPRFNGPAGDNISADTGLLKKWPEGGPELLWTAKGIGAGFSGVTIVDGLIYTSGNLGDKTLITALDLDGNAKWTADGGPAWTESYPGARGTPTQDAGRLYHESPLGQIVCLHAKTGEKLWELNILDEFGAENIRWALAESLLIDGDRVICCPGGPRSSVVALDKRTGSVVWKAAGTGNATAYASPSLAECGGLRIVLTMNAKALIGVSADSGELLFEFPHVARYDVNALMPVYRDGHVFISSGYRSGSVLVKLDVDGGRVTAEEAWRSKELDNHHGGVVLLDGHIYGSAHASNHGRWICLDWKTGQMKYAEEGVGKGSLTCAEGMLYTINESRAVGLAEATPDGHELVGYFELPSGGKGPTWAHPVVCGGRLYIRHNDFLYAYDVRAND